MATEESKLDQLLKGRAAVDEQLRRQQHPIQLTILFVDPIEAAQSAEQETAAIHSRRTVEIEQFGGRVIKTLDDSVMAEFPDPLSGVRAATELQRRQLRSNKSLPPAERTQLRIGLAHGACFRQGSDAYGDAVELAACICKRTGPAQVIISAAVREAIAGHADLRCNYMGQVQPEGKGERENIFEVVWTAAAEYADLRQHATMALKRGDIHAAGLKVDDLVQPSPPPAPPRQPEPLPEDVMIQRTAEFVVPPPRALETRYEIECELGKGGMGVVYKARDRETGDVVALKVLRGEIATDETSLARFKNELRIARRITHKNICRIHEFNRAGDVSYISMEYIEGESLRHIIHHSGGLPTAKAVVIGQQICAGLAEAHAQGVVHRDLKPENVMLDGAGVVRVMDFGIARPAGGTGMTQTGSVVGTPAYMAPEQAESRNIDHRADIYSLGLILYELFTGTPTFQAETPIAIVLKHLSEVPTPPRSFKASIPVHIERAILRCLEKKPENRFQSVQEVAAALTLEPPKDLPADATVGVAPKHDTGETRVLDSQELLSHAIEARAAQPGPTFGETSVITPAKPVAARPAPPQPAPPSYTAEPGAKPAAAPVSAPAPPAARPAPRAGGLGLVIAGVVVVVVIGAIFVYRLLRPTLEQPASQNAQQVSSQTPGQTGTPSSSQPPASSSANPSSSAPAPVTPIDLSAGNPAAQPPTGGTQPANPAGPNVSAPAPKPSAPAPLSLSFSLGRTLAGHTAAVTAIAFSADGRLIASGGQDRTVRVWNAGSGQSVQVMKGHVDGVLAVAFTPDGHHVASASRDKSTRIWDISSGREVLTFPRESAFVLAVVFSPDGRFMATSIADGRVKLWEAGTTNLVGTFEGHNGPVFALAFSPDGHLLASAGGDNTVRLWNVTTGSPVRALTGHEQAVTSVAFSRDGRQVAAGSDDESVLVWEAATGRQIGDLDQHDGAVNGVAFGGDGRWLASGGEDKLVLVWDVANGKVVTALQGHVFSVSRVITSPDGRWIASASADKTIKLWRKE